MAGKRRPKPKPDIKPCLGCGERYLPYRKYQKFCSVPCRGKYWRQANKRIGYGAQIRDLDRRLRIVEGQINLKEET
jgi:hypothetical protein